MVPSSVVSAPPCGGGGGGGATAAGTAALFRTVHAWLDHSLDNAYSNYLGLCRPVDRGVHLGTQLGYTRARLRLGNRPYLRLEDGNGHGYGEGGALTRLQTVTDGPLPTWNVVVERFGTLVAAAPPPAAAATSGSLEAIIDSGYTQTSVPESLLQAVLPLAQYPGAWIASASQTTRLSDTVRERLPTLHVRLRAAAAAAQAYDLFLPKEQYTVRKADGWHTLLQTSAIAGAGTRMVIGNTAMRGHEWVFHWAGSGGSAAGDDTAAYVAVAPARRAPAPRPRDARRV